MHSDLRNALASTGQLGLAGQPEASGEAYRDIFTTRRWRPRARACGKASREPPSPSGSRRHRAKTTVTTSRFDVRSASSSSAVTRWNGRTSPAAPARGP
jgi:hypothetical protein